MRSALTAAAMAGGLIPAAFAGTAQAAPSLDLPFKCKSTMYGKVWTGHIPANGIDFNGAGGGDSDIGVPIVASGAGRVIKSLYYDRKSNIGYGNVVEIRHEGGVRTFYAHLRDRKVKTGQRVRRGQLIGHLGKSSAKYTFAAHLHYEQRNSSGSVIKSRFRGKLAPEYANIDTSIKHVSRNCAATPAPQQPDPTPQQPTPTPQHPGVPLPNSGFRRTATIRTDNGLPVHARRAPRPSAASVRTFSNGNRVKIVCQTTGARVTGKYGTSRLWDLIDLGNGRGAYVTDTYVYTGSDGRVAPACPS